MCVDVLHYFCHQQIVSTGENEENAFIFNEDNLELILSKIPPNTKVAVLSVVGAFRTGKVRYMLERKQIYSYLSHHHILLCLSLTVILVEFLPSLPSTRKC